MYHFKIVENTFIPLTEVGQEVLTNPRPIVQQLDTALLWAEVDVDLSYELSQGNICGVEKQYLEFAHGL